MLPAPFAKLHPRYRTPTNAIFMMGFLSCLAPFFGRPALVWIVKLAVLGVLLYAAFWLALLLVFVTAAAWASAANSPDEDAWPFTDMDELRNTPGYDPNLYNDHTHVDYKDD